MSATARVTGAAVAGPDYAYRGGQLCFDDVPLATIADDIGTPCYVYSRRAIEARWRAYDAAFGTRPHRVCYAVKANDNLSIIRVLSAPAPDSISSPAVT